MLIFRTILLWSAVVLLVVMEFTSFNDLRFGLTLRLIPSLLLLVWFLSFLSGRKRRVIRDNVPVFKMKILKVLKVVANLTIVAGALLKIGHYAYSQLLLIVGIFFLAAWSTLLVTVSSEKPAYNPEIIDDIYEESKEE